MSFKKLPYNGTFALTKTYVNSGIKKYIRDEKKKYKLKKVTVKHYRHRNDEKNVIITKLIHLLSINTIQNDLSEHIRTSKQRAICYFDLIQR